MKATGTDGALKPIPNCYVKVGGKKIDLYALPEISDGKQAAYNDEPIMGRSFPLKTFSHGENRSISFDIPMYITEDADPELNLANLRAIESAVYPEDGKDDSAPYFPPKPCQVKCGRILGEDELCCVLRGYSVRFQSDVAWDEDTMLPYKFIVSCQFEAIYKSDDLPGASRILSSGR